MKAVIMAGGEGTRLRPLTSNQPKPMMPLANRPMMEHIVRLLKEHGFDEIVVTLAFLPQTIRTYFGDGSEFGVSLVYATEETPLGTAGSVRNARAELDEPFLVISGDVLTDIDLSALVAFHEEKGAKATLALIAVDDTSSYGVVPTDEDGAVEAFLEKSPGPAPTNRINAGAYVIEREVVERIEPDRAVSFEREIFPSLVGEGLYGWFAEGYWIDIGTPERYLEATYDLLSGRVHSTLPPRDETGSLIYEPALVAGAHIGPQSVLGPHCSVGVESTVERSVLHSRVTVGSGCTIREAVLSDGVHVGDGAEIGPGAMLGEGVVVQPGEVVSADARVDPGASVG
jgi:NDP-sugar pyrophosphorylase family protein